MVEAEPIAQKMFDIYAVLLGSTNYGIKASIGLGVVADVLNIPPTACDVHTFQVK